LAKIKNNAAHSTANAYQNYSAYHHYMAATATTPRKKQTPATVVTPAYRQEVLEDFRICAVSREASVIARKEVLTGKANFGIIGDGKELAQVAMAKAWRKGDFRSGYYRDQTLHLALGVTTLEEFFAQLYGDPVHDPFSTGRQMNCHFATPFIDNEGNFLDLKNRYNISSDIASTGGQMARGLGLAFASKKFREQPQLCGDLSDKGAEVCFVTIGDASTSEGVFWEAINAAGVTQVPLAVSVWDDGYGISVPKKYQTTKESISEILAGFDGENGVNIYTAKAWDYVGLCNLYRTAIDEMRITHQPALFHIQEVTQQLGHSTSGDHRRYKSPERLAFEEAFDCNKRFEQWIVENGIATQEELDEIKAKAKAEATEAARVAYRRYQDAVTEQRNHLNGILQAALAAHPQEKGIEDLRNEMMARREPLMRFDLLKTARKAQHLVVGQHSTAATQLAAFADTEAALGKEWYSSNLHSQSPKSPLNIRSSKPTYSDASPMKDGYEVLNACFDYHFEHNPQVFAFGEDVGQIGDVNQGFRGLQQKFGTERIFDTGIREWTIMGQAIGMAMRGLRPIAEIQYLDYIYYGLTPLADDLTSLRWRTNNLQAAPAIIRTRGHRLVGVWHAGSPMGMMLGALRGMWFCVPRDMTQAAGMYNTLLQSDDPAIVVECLNGYRLKEALPDNIGTFTVALGEPEVLQQGTDVTLVTYGSCVRVAEEAIEQLTAKGISVELVDVQTLLPFDLVGTCVESLKKTNRLVVLDEDVPGGASAYMLQQILEVQGGYRYLDAAPLTITAQEHRTAYGQDGDYFTKPQAEDVFEAIWNLMHEDRPAQFPRLHFRR
jgi:pyruvate/2-oxoglutarate/acetoin dehydrogenase E1 component/TPP-dependent pyruvate/acetoin dehydrogenase alpha subunit